MIVQIGLIKSAVPAMGQPFCFRVAGQTAGWHSVKKTVDLNGD